MTLIRSVVALACAMTLATPTLAADFEFKFQSSDPAGSPNFALQQEWIEDLAGRTDGRVAIELLPTGAVVEYNETQDAISIGILDGHITDTSYFAGRDPAFGLIANPVGAWSDPRQMLDFMYNGGGAELMRELTEPYGIYFIGATTPGLEAFVSRVPLDGVDDLQGLKVRAPEGLIQQVFAAAGASPVNLPFSELFTSLDKKVIDAADATVFSTNQEVGLHDAAPHPVYPGFHSLPLVEISVNKARWDALPEDIQTAFSESVKHFADRQIDIVIERDLAAVAEAEAGGEITVHDWPAEERAKFRTIALGEWETVADKSPASGRVFQVLKAYLTENNLVNLE